MRKFLFAAAAASLKFQFQLLYLGESLVYFIRTTPTAFCMEAPQHDCGESLPGVQMVSPTGKALLQYKNKRCELSKLNKDRKAFHRQKPELCICKGLKVLNEKGYHENNPPPLPFKSWVKKSTQFLKH